MINLLRADLFAARRSWGLRIALLLSALMVVAYTISSHAMATGSLEPSANSAASMASDVITSAILISLAAAVVVSQSFESKAIHDAVLMVDRWQIVTARMLSFVVCGIVLLSPWVVTAAVAFVAGWELFSPIPTTYTAVANNLTGIDPTFANVALACLLLAVGTLNYLAMYSVCVIVAFVVRKPVVVVVTGVLVGFFGSFLSDRLGQFGPLAWLAKALPYHPDNLLTLDATAASITSTALTSLGFLAVVSLVGIALFRRAEIK